MKFLKLSLISAVMLLSFCASLATADDTPLPSWEDVSDTSFARSDSISPHIKITTGDEPATAWYEYGATSAYGKTSVPITIPEHSSSHYVADLEADYPGGWVAYQLHLETATKSILGPPGGSPTRGPVPVNLIPPSIVGLPYVGRTLVCDPGSWNWGNENVSFRWNGIERSSTPGWNELYGSTIKLNEGDLGRDVSCTATLSISRVGSTQVTTAAVTVRPEPQDPAGTVTVLAQPKDCIIPNLRGATFAAARAKLKAANCGVHVRHEWSTNVKKGRVIRSGRFDHTRATLVVSKGKKPKKR